MSNQYVGNIGLVDDNILFGKSSSGGQHYVLISSFNQKNNKVRVNVIQSLEDKQGNIKQNLIGYLRQGRIFPIPKRHANFTKWSGIRRNDFHRNLATKQPLLISDVKTKLARVKFIKRKSLRTFKKFK